MTSGFDSERSLSFPTADGRELVLWVNIDTGVALIKEVLDGEEEVLSTSMTEIKTIAYFIGLMEGEQKARLNMKQNTSLIENAI